VKAEQSSAEQAGGQVKGVDGSRLRLPLIVRDADN
jgi:hypothetical protein